MKEMWISEKECTGCAACANICPKNAIELISDPYGFIMPVISDSCVECNLCSKVCASREIYGKENSVNPATYAVWSKNANSRFQSTSGGAFTELAKVILQQGGSIVGAAYTSDNMVNHIMVNDSDDLDKLKQSKYLQSEIGMIFRKVKNELEEGRCVAFCGSPCQVAGLYAYLEKPYENLYTIDFICRGMNSPKAYRSWLDEVEQRQGSKAVKVWFKYKIGGWKKSPRCTRVDFEDGTHIVQNQENNIFMVGYLGQNLYIRPSCGDCRFKGIPRQSDITLADFWGLDAAIDDDQGASMMLINSKKGASLFEQARECLIIYQREFKEIFAGNTCFDSSVKINTESKNFLLALDKMPFSKAIKKFTGRTLMKRIQNKIKNSLCK